ncbi:MAG: hypothetical protein VYA11_06940 [Planctomycetota bacterium]|nr:hypothetical protein [Planctomycetota bacterium]
MRIPVFTQNLDRRRGDNAAPLGCILLLLFLLGFATSVMADSPKTGAGVLPSEKPSTPLPLRPREILAEVGINPDQLQEIHRVEAPLEKAATRTLILQLLFRLEAMPQRNLEYWSEENGRDQDRPWEKSSPLGSSFFLAGKAKLIDAIMLDERDQLKFEKKRVFRYQISLPTSAGPQPAILFTSTVPKQLPLGEPISVECSAHTVFVGLDDATGNPLFIAPRLAWHPDTLLGDLKMDVSLLENIENSKPLRGEEFEAFYQMLAAAKRTAAGELSRHAYNQLLHETKMNQQAQSQLKDSGIPLSDTELRKKTLLETQLDYMQKNASHPFVPLVEHPDRFNGQLIMLRGTAYRIVKVRINEPAIRQRFGIDHYYQIDMRVNLEHKVKLVTSRTEEGETEKVKDEKIVTQHPATFCALSLPPGMPTGDNLLEPIRVAGFYFKNWQYQTAQMRGDQTAERVAPMLIGRQPVWDVRKASELEKYGGLVVGILFLVVLLAIWGIVWWTGRGDVAIGKKFREVTGSNDPLALDVELDGAELTFPFENPHAAPPGVDRENDA